MSHQSLQCMCDIVVEHVVCFMFQQLASMWRLYSTKTSSSRCGILVDKQVSGENSMKGYKLQLYAVVLLTDALN